MMNQTNAPLLEKVLEFTAARHQLIADNMANVDTPGYRQKDLDAGRFYSQLQRRVADRADAAPGEVGFENISTDVKHPNDGILFHDGNNRSMEQMTTEMAKNAMLHNMVIELLRKQFAQMDMALKDKGDVEGFAILDLRIAIEDRLMFNALDTSSSALQAQRTRLDTIAARILRI